VTSEKVGADVVDSDAARAAGASPRQGALARVTSEKVGAAVVVWWTVVLLVRPVLLFVEERWLV
jgi:hypothetical protein